MKTNIIFIALAAIFLIAAGYMYRNSSRLEEELRVSKQASVEANLQLGEAKTRLGDAQKTAEAQHNEDTDKLLKMTKDYKQVVTRYSELEAKYSAKGDKVVTIEVPGPTVTITSDLKLIPHNLYWAHDEKSLLDLGQDFGAHLLDQRISIDSSLLGDPAPSMKISYNLHLKLRASFIESIDKQGVIHNYGKLWEVDEQGNKLGEFQLSSYETTITDDRIPHFFWFVPHLDIGLIAGISTRSQLGGTIGLSLMGYGLTENDLSWRFFRLGVNLSKDNALSITPALWNAAGPIPLLSNLWVGPFISYGFNRALGVGLNLNVVM